MQCKDEDEKTLMHNTTQPQNVTPHSIIDAEQLFPHAYVTCDFDFATFVLAHGDPEVNIAALVLVEDDARFSRKSGMVKYQFHIVGVSNEDVRELLETLSMRYVSGQTRVEPMRLLQFRKQLAGRIKHRDLLLFESMRTLQNQNQNEKASKK